MWGTYVWKGKQWLQGCSTHIVYWDCPPPSGAGPGWASGSILALSPSQTWLRTILIAAMPTLTAEQAEAK
jgi:hypothetical protein